MIRPLLRWPLRSAAGGLRVACLVLAVPVAYLGVLTAAAWFATLTGRGHRPAGARTTRVAVLIPAHDEELVLGETLAAMARLDYPTDRYGVHVVADHCSDGTVGIAAAAGVVVHEHVGTERGKGPALQWTIDGLLAGGTGIPPDVVAIVDADTIVAPGFLTAVDAAFAGGARAVQGHYRVRDPGSSAGAGLRAAALALRHHLRPLGRTTLGASCGLYGNGMAFSVDVLRDRRWSGHLTEDVEFQMELLLAGVSVDYAPDAVVEAEMPATLDAARTQNERWEQGRLDLVRRYLPALLRSAQQRRGQQRVAAVDAVLDHLVPPLSVLTAAVGGVAAAESLVAIARGRWPSRLALVLPAVLVAHVGSGLVLARVPWSVYRSLLRAPSMVVWKVRLWAGVLVRPGDTTWIRTAVGRSRGVSRPVGRLPSRRGSMGDQ